MSTPLRKWAHALAMMALQGDRYARDPMFGEAVDMVLAYTNENGRGAEGDPHRTGLTPEGSRKVAERNGGFKEGGA